MKTKIAIAVLCAISILYGDTASKSPVYWDPDMKFGTTTNDLVMGTNFIIIPNEYLPTLLNTNSTPQEYIPKFSDQKNVIQTPTKSDQVSELLKQVRMSECMTELVNQLCSAGEVCKVKGHHWRGGRPGETENFMYNDYHPNITYRTCSICGTCQSLEWK